MKTKYMVLFTLIFLMVISASATYTTEGVSNTQTAGGTIEITDGVNNTQTTQTGTISGSGGSGNSGVISKTPIPTVTIPSTLSTTATQVIPKQTTITAQQSILSIPIDIKTPSFNILIAVIVSIIVIFGIIGIMTISIKRKK